MQGCFNIKISINMMINTMQRINRQTMKNPKIILVYAGKKMW